jgi:hypothetical protein
LPGQDSQDRTARTRLIVQSYEDRTARRIQDKKERIARKGQPEQDCQHRTTSARQAEKTVKQDRRDRTSRTGRLGQDCEDRAARIGLPAQYR